MRYIFAGMVLFLSLIGAVVWQLAGVAENIGMASQEVVAVSVMLLIVLGGMTGLVLYLLA